MSTVAASAKREVEDRKEGKNLISIIIFYMGINCLDTI